MNQIFEFVRQFLGAADAEGQDEDGAVVFQRVFDGGLEARRTGTVVFADTVAVGAFEDEDVRALRRLGAGSSGLFGASRSLGKTIRVVLEASSGS